MSRYLVCWLIDSDAESPLQAAIDALETQRATDGCETVFEVYERGTGEAWRVDLEPRCRTAIIDSHGPMYAGALGILDAQEGE